MLIAASLCYTSVVRVVCMLLICLSCSRSSSSAVDEKDPLFTKNELDKPVPQVRDRIAPATTVPSDCITVAGADASDTAQMQRMPETNSAVCLIAHTSRRKSCSQACGADGLGNEISREVRTPLSLFVTMGQGDNLSTRDVPLSLERGSIVTERGMTTLDVLVRALPALGGEVGAFVVRVQTIDQGAPKLHKYLYVVALGAVDLVDEADVTDENVTYHVDSSAADTPRAIYRKDAHGQVAFRYGSAGYVRD